MSRFKQVHDIDSDILWVREVGLQRYHFVRIQYTDEWGDSPEHKYHATLAEVDAWVFTDRMWKGVWDSVGGHSSWEDSTIEARAYCAFEYGMFALLHQGDGNNLQDLERESKRESYQLTLDRVVWAEALNNPVNALGSTAFEYMVGAIDLAVARGVAAGRTDAVIVDKMCGGRHSRAGLLVNAPYMFSVQLQGVPGEDPIAYNAGFTEGYAVVPPRAEPREEVSSQFIEGYRHGLRVRLEGESMPEWVRVQQ